MTNQKTFLESVLALEIIPVISLEECFLKRYEPRLDKVLQVELFAMKLEIEMHVQRNMAGQNSGYNSSECSSASPFLASYIVAITIGF